MKKLALDKSFAEKNKMVINQRQNLIAKLKISYKDADDFENYSMLSSQNVDTFISSN